MPLGEPFAPHPPSDLILEEAFGKTDYKKPKFCPYTLGKPTPLYCIKEECMAWIEPCKNKDDCKECAYFDEDDPDGCLGKTGFCELIRPIQEGFND